MSGTSHYLCLTFVCGQHTYCASWVAMVLCRHCVYIINHYYIMVVRAPCAGCLGTVVVLLMVSLCVFTQLFSHIVQEL